MSGFPGAINQVSRKSDPSEPAERLFKPGCSCILKQHKPRTKRVRLSLDIDPYSLN